MLETVKGIAGVVATCSEFIAVVVIVIGAAQAIASSFNAFVRTKDETSIH